MLEPAGTAALALILSPIPANTCGALVLHVLLWLIVFEEIVGIGNGIHLSALKDVNERCGNRRVSDSSDSCTSITPNRPSTTTRESVWAIIMGTVLSHNCVLFHRIIQRYFKNFVSTIPSVFKVYIIVNIIIISIVLL
jgi:hypothetical protein